MSSGVGTPPTRAEALEIAAASLAAIDELCDLMPVADELAVLERIRAHCDARESRRLAARLESGVTSRSVQSLLQRSEGVSTRSDPI